uniref:Uncharacterized protein n=1 Tax=Arion vulgaris TaxID=1028688 RepID=A0A0B7ASP6_9EUPU
MTTTKNRIKAFINMCLYKIEVLNLYDKITHEELKESDKHGMSINIEQLIV